MGLNHSHSIVLSHGNALNFQRKFFLCATKNRLTDPSEIRAFDFKHEFRRSAIYSVSDIIGIDRPILGIFREDGGRQLSAKKTVSNGAARVRPQRSSRANWEMARLGAIIFGSTEANFKT